MFFCLMSIPMLCSDCFLVRLHFEEIREKANGVSNGPDLNADGSVYYDDEGFTYIASEIADLRDATTTQKWFLERLHVAS